MGNKILILHFEYYVFNFFEVGWQLRFYTFVVEKIIIKIYDIMANVIHWFEIPSKNFDRACTFYGQIMEWEIQKINHENGIKYGFLPMGTQDEVGGAIVHGGGFEPSSKGSLIYLNAGADLSIALSKVEKAGGKILKPKTSIGENGYMAQFIDTEGNRVALHSMK